MPIIVLIIKYLKIKNISNNVTECLNIEIVSKTSKNVIIFYICRLPSGNAHNVLDKMNDHIIKNKFPGNPLFLVGVT